jgi:cellulose synthase/poly-beta-1,6-N-acetylglucosamine synthase-like glycosyltransferase
VVATRDEPAIVVDRVRNLRASEYPAPLLSVVVAVDRTSSFPLEAYGQALDDLADVVAGDGPGGKAATLNAGVRAAGACDVLAFADAGQEFNPPAIRYLVGELARDLDGVTGRYAQRRNDTLMVAYADLEAVIRAGQAAGRSVVSATGAILAIRPRMWRDLPAGLICDDLFTGLSIARQGGRLGFCPHAVAFDVRTFTRDQQFARRARTLTGLIQYCAVAPGSLVPWRNPIWVHFVLHKLLRLLTPIPLAIGAVSLAAWVLLQWPTATLVGLAAVTIVVVAGGLVAPRAFARLREQLRWVLQLQLVPAVAIANGLRGRWAVWTPTPHGRGPAGSA